MTGELILILQNGLIFREITFAYWMETDDYSTNVDKIEDEF